MFSDVRNCLSAMLHLWADFLTFISIGQDVSPDRTKNEGPGQLAPIFVAGGIEEKHSRQAITRNFK